jgi:hypothetical protein
MIKKKEITFPNGNRAQLVRPVTGTRAADILKKLGIEQPEALIMIIGGADNVDGSLNLLLVQLFSRGIARIAAETGAMIIDGGTRTGVMELMGLGVADRGIKSILLGVEPAGRVTYPGDPKEGSKQKGAPLDPNHSHFVLAYCDDWGCEDTVMFELAQALAQRTPVVTILVNGGEHSKNEVLKSVCQG